MRRRPPRSPLVPYTTLFRSRRRAAARAPRRRPFAAAFRAAAAPRDRKSTRLNSSHTIISYAVFCLKKEEVVVHPHSSRSPEQTAHQRGEKTRTRRDTPPPPPPPPPPRPPPSPPPPPLLFLKARASPITTHFPSSTRSRG